MTVDRNWGGRGGVTHYNYRTRWFFRACSRRRRSVLRVSGQVQETRSTNDNETRTSRESEGRPWGIQTTGRTNEEEVPRNMVNNRTLVKDRFVTVQGLSVEGSFSVSSSYDMF